MCRQCRKLNSGRDKPSEALPNHVHHEDDVEDNEEVVCVPEDLIVGHPVKKNKKDTADVFKMTS